MSDTENRKAFEAAMLNWGWDASDFAMDESGLFYRLDDTRMAFRGWLARDTEVSALKARVAELTNALHGISLESQSSMGGMREYLGRMARNTLKESSDE